MLITQKMRKKGRMIARGKDGYQRIVDNKLRGAYGETDIENKVIRINKKLHKKSNNMKWGIPKKDGTIINTLVHEEMHAKHPKMHERTVRKKTAAKVSMMSAMKKLKLYGRYRG